MAASSAKNPLALNTDAIAEMEEDLAGLRALTMEERGRMIASACRAAARFERSKQANAFAPSEREPWPQSTWEFLKKHAADARARTTS